MGVMKRLATGAGGPRIRTGRYNMASDGFHVDFSMFVDRKGVMDRVDRKTLRILSGTGAYAMGAMRKSIRARSNSKKARTVQVGDLTCVMPEGARQLVLDAKTGRPVSYEAAQQAHINFRQQRVAEGVGNPPRRGPSDLLRKRIFFGVEADTETVVIGPEMFAKQPRLVGAVSVPQLLDQGGQEEVRFGGRSFLGTYKPRPFVGPTLPIAQRRMEELTEEIPL